MGKPTRLKRGKDIDVKLPATRGPACYRATFSLPVPLATGISRVARRMRITQSALVTALMTEGIEKLEGLLSALPQMPVEADVRGFRSHARTIISDAVKRALEVVDGDDAK